MKSYNIQTILQWYQNSGCSTVSEYYCGTRDVFEGRLSKVAQIAQKNLGMTENESFLMTAVIGEVGNNSYDHNLGHWAYEPGLHYGVWCQNGELICLIADRGRGIHASLLSAHKNIGSQQEALETAFQKKISGRFPERRGNGLKFVRQVINGNLNRGIWCRSGDATASFGKLGEYAAAQAESIKSLKCCGGTITILVWRQ
jgi:hypothetical protein